MIKCEKCNSKFTIKNRINTLFDKNKILVCHSCGSKYGQSLIQVKISFILSAIIFIIMNNKIRLYISNWIYSDFLIEILRLGLGAMWMISFVFLSQFWSGYSNYK